MTTTKNITDNGAWSTTSTSDKNGHVNGNSIDMLEDTIPVKFTEKPYSSVSKTNCITLGGYFINQHYNAKCSIILPLHVLSEIVS